MLLLPFQTSEAEARDLNLAVQDFLQKSEIFLDTGLTIERRATPLHAPMRSLMAGRQLAMQSDRLAQSPGVKTVFPLFAPGNRAQRRIEDQRAE